MAWPYGRVSIRQATPDPVNGGEALVPILKGPELRRHRAHRGRYGASHNTARGTPGDRRTCGHYPRGGLGAVRH